MILIRAGVLSRLFIQEMKVSQINEDPERLAENEDRVLPVQRVEQQRQAPGDAEPPEGTGDHTPLFPLAHEPLNEEAGKEEGLPAEPENQPESFPHG